MHSLWADTRHALANYFGIWLKDTMPLTDEDVPVLLDIIDI